MAKPKMTYFSREDVLHLVISEEHETNSIEVSPNITAELNDRGELIGIEILQASTYLSPRPRPGINARASQKEPPEGDSN